VWVRLHGRWKALPRRARWVLALYMAGFAEGTGDHVRWMAHGGIHAYARSYPQVPIQVFFVLLIVLDPLTVALIGFVRRAGVWLAVAVMALDIAANWSGNWSQITSAPANLLHTGPWLITAFGVFVFASSPALLRLMRSDRPLTAAVPGAPPADAVRGR
jgi:hypothetical protein